MKSAAQPKREGTSPYASLNQIYGHRTGVWQSLSMLLNASLMVYAHFGLSAVFVSNQQRVDELGGSSDSSTITTNTTIHGACSVSDVERWERVGARNKIAETNDCSVGEPACVLNEECHTDCMTNIYNYTRPCSDCFADIPLCVLLYKDGCGISCSIDPFSEECIECSRECNEIFGNCSGLDVSLLYIDYDGAVSNETDSTETEAPILLDNQSSAQTDVCEVQQAGVDLEEVDTFHTVYEVMFFEAMETAWNTNAELLAVIVVLFSGIWPYTKNIILMFAWYLPLSTSRRSFVLKWLRRLGKYTLVDIYIIIVLSVGIIIEINVADVPVIVRGEPRSAIIAFLIATLWEFVHIEWMTAYHRRAYYAESPRKEHQSQPNIMRQLTFRGRNKGESAATCANPSMTRGFMCLLLAASIALYVVGSFVDLVSFEIRYTDDPEACVRSYNLFTLGTAFVDDFFLYRSSVKGQLWFLYLSYISFVAIIPLCVHLVHVLALVFDFKDRHLFHIMDVSWTFASVEVLLVGIFVIQYKFDFMTVAFAGAEGSQFFAMDATLEPGFFILIAYSVVGGLLHYFFSGAVSQYYQVEPDSSIDWPWEKVFGSCLVSSESKPKDRVMDETAQPDDPEFVEEAAC